MQKDSLQSLQIESEMGATFRTIFIRTRVIFRAKNRFRARHLTDV